ncbi:hypothetical protein CHS0354_015880 [Potamilus streckersoni]|uniref:Uncharacterized protein n=1 Tax=Potamilus streckersoni TaxID=2493646 RepID=A0AAE0VTS9_9BIVA|nr:hypothetical protein CHS0354_015880 [Potamilus streckersoni]
MRASPFSDTHVTYPVQPTGCQRMASPATMTKMLQVERYRFVLVPTRRPNRLIKKPSDTKILSTERKTLGQFQTMAAYAAARMSPYISRFNS